MGLIKEGDDIAILTDILGDEDHLGDMDFKVIGNSDGISGLQMDIKIDGLTGAVLTTALEQARVARLHILDEMAKTISSPLAPFSRLRWYRDEYGCQTWVYFCWPDLGQRITCKNTDPAGDPIMGFQIWGKQTSGGEVNITAHDNITGSTVNNRVSVGSCAYGGPGGVCV